MDHIQLPIELLRTDSELSGMPEIELLALQASLHAFAARTTAQQNKVSAELQRRVAAYNALRFNVSPLKP